MSSHPRIKFILPRLGFILLALVFTLTFVFRPVSAAIGFRAASTAGNNGATSLSVDMPTGTVQDDVMIAVVSARGGTGTTITPPSGWNLINSNNSGTTIKSSTYYKVAGASEAGPYVFSVSPSNKTVAVISSYSGVDTANPINAQGSQANASSTTTTAPSVTTTVSDTWIIAAFSTAIGTSFTPGSSMTERGDISSGAGASGTRNTSQLQDVTQASTGATGTKTATAGAAAVNIGHTIALRPFIPLSLTQAGYRWFENADSATAGSPLAAQDTSTTVDMSTPFRLRMLIGVDGSSITSANEFKLQYKHQASGTCTSTGTFSDVTTSSPIRYYNNASVADGAALGSTGNDPVRSGVTRINQTYEEANIFAPSSTVADGQDGMWDFALEAAPSASFEGAYCLRAVKADDSPLDTYSVVPEIALRVPPGLLTGNDYRLYQNADSLTPGSPLADPNTSAILSAAGDNFRVRSGVSISGYWKQISTGGSHTCAIASDNQAYCWGSDTSGQLGNGATTGTQVSPVAVDTSGVLSGKTILSISAGFSHTCAIASDNQAYCWGSDGSGQLGDGGANTNQPSPVAVDTSGDLSGKTILSISAGGSHTCAIASDGLAYCWGNDNNGQLGNGATTGNQIVPDAVDTSIALSGRTILQVAAGDNSTCVIANNNLPYCWGWEDSGRLGNGSTSGTQPSPIGVNTSGALSGKTILSISVEYHACVVASDNLAYCWGYDSNGQLGDGGTKTDQSTPVAVDTSGVLSGKTILSITAGNFHTCAIASDNQAYCWGSDTNGQLGNGATTGDQVSPVVVDTSGVLSGKTILSISAGGAHTCAIASDNQAYCWGSDTNGQLGNGATSGDQVSPVAVTTELLSPISLVANKLNLSLQFAQKTVGSCSAQTGFANITGSTVIAYQDNASAANGATITTNTNDPISTASSTAQTYHEAVGTITNPNTIDGGKIGLWDFSLRDNNAPASTTYCLRLAGDGGESFADYLYLPEITTAAAAGLTLEQMTRGGGGVINGVKQNYSW